MNWPGRCVSAVLLTCTASAGSGAGTGTEILDKVAKTYRDLGDYRVEIISSTNGECINCMPPGRQPNAPMLPASRPKILNRITLARSGNALYYNVDGAEFSFTWITDGSTTWSYRKDLNEYIQSGPEPQVSGEPPPHTLSHLEWRFLTRFRNIAQDARNIAITRVGRTLGSDSIANAALIVIDLGDDPPAAERLLVDMDSGIVRNSTKIEEQVLRGQRQRYTTETSWTSVQLSTPDAAMFRFTPPRRSHRVKRFSERTNQIAPWPSSAPSLP